MLRLLALDSGNGILQCGASLACCHGGPGETVSMCPSCWPGAFTLTLSMLSVPNLDLVPGFGFLIPTSLTAPACDAQDRPLPPNCLHALSKSQT